MVSPNALVQELLLDFSKIKVWPSMIKGWLRLNGAMVSAHSCRLFCVRRSRVPPSKAVFALWTGLPHNLPSSLPVIHRHAHRGVVETPSCRGVEVGADLRLHCVGAAEGGVLAGQRRCCLAVAVGALLAHGGDSRGVGAVPAP